LKQNIRIVGTTRSNKLEIPKEFLTSRTKEVNLSMSGFTNDVIFGVTCAEEKSVILLSTQHREKDIGDKDPDFRPEITVRYSNPKGAVDTEDKMI
jgi:hypothetical protein